MTHMVLSVVHLHKHLCDCLVKRYWDIKAAHSSFKRVELCCASMLLTNEIFCSLCIVSIAAGISKRRRVATVHPYIHERRSLPSSITIQFACLCDGVHYKVKLATEFTDLFLCHMRSPDLTLVHNAVPSETWPASLCR